MGLLLACRFPLTGRLLPVNSLPLALLIDLLLPVKSVPGALLLQCIARLIGLLAGQGGVKPRLGCTLLPSGCNAAVSDSCLAAWAAVYIEYSLGNGALTETERSTLLSWERRSKTKADVKIWAKAGWLWGLRTYGRA